MEADRPIVKASEDLLGRGQLAEHIAKTALSYRERDSLVVGILGPWGSGKTSLLNLIEDSLSRRYKPWASEYEPGANREKEPIVLHFDPWWYTGQEGLLQRFFNELSSQLRERLPHQFSDLVSSMTQFARKLAPVATLVAPYPFDKLSGFAEKLLDNTPSLDEVRRKIESALDRLNTPVWVFIDDLDRLQARELLQIFALLRSIANLPYTRYFLAMDPDSVSRQLKESANIQHGQSYLEKIIQLSYTLPAPADDALKKQFIDGTLRLFEGTSLPPGLGPKQQIEDTWKTLSSGSTPQILTTLRQVKLLFNAIELSYPSGLREELWPGDVVLLEALRVFDPGTYQALEEGMARATNALGNEPEFLDWQDEDKYRNQVVFASYPDKLEAWTREALNHLFVHQSGKPEDKSGKPEDKQSKDIWIFGASSDAAVRREARDPRMIWRYIRKKLPEVGREQVRLCAEYLSADNQGPLPEALSGSKDPDWAASLIGQVTSPLWEYSPDKRRAILKGVLVLVEGLWDKLPQPPGRAAHRLLGSVVSGFFNLAWHDLLEGKEQSLKMLEGLGDPLLRNYLLSRLKEVLEKFDQADPDISGRVDKVDEEAKRAGTEAFKFLTDFPDKVKSRPLDLIFETLIRAVEKDRLQYLQGLAGSKEHIQNFLCKLRDWDPAIWKGFVWLGYKPDGLAEFHNLVQGTENRPPGTRQSELKKLGDDGWNIIREAAMESDYWEELKDIFL